jgi:hypothetical protein
MTSDAAAPATLINGANDSADCQVQRTVRPLAREFAEAAFSTNVP